MSGITKYDQQAFQQMAKSIAQTHHTNWKHLSNSSCMTKKCELNLTVAYNPIIARGFSKL